jgi:hypothetical protein
MVFLDHKRWDLENLWERLSDIDEIDKLASELREFSSSLPSQIASPSFHTTL